MRGSPASPAPPGRAWKGCLAALLLLALSTGLRAQTPDLQITLFSEPSGRERLAVAYNRAPSEADARAQLDALARRLRVAPRNVRLSTEAGITVLEAELSGLTDWSTGTVNLDPLVDAFRGFGHFRVTILFFGNFPLRSAESLHRPPVRVQARAGPGSVDYEIWIDQSRGVPDQLPSLRDRPGVNWMLLAGLAALAGVLATGIYLAVSAALAQRRAT